MKRKNNRPKLNKSQWRLRRAVKRVQSGAMPPDWLIKECWKDEEPKTLTLRRIVFPNLCAPDPLAFSFAQLNNLAKIYYNPRVVEQFKKSVLLRKAWEEQ